MVAYLQKPKGSEAFHKIFLGTSTARTTDDAEVEKIASIDRQVKTITEASLRRHLKLEDSNGITSLPNTDIFEQLALMGYVSDSDRLTFQKGHFSPQWRFFIHTILHCLSPKTTYWEQFSSNIATAIICLATNRTFNFSKMIFDAMVKNLDSTHKFLMYPRFLHICLNKQKSLLQPHTIIYLAHTLTKKLFSNMKRASRGYCGVDFPLFPTMITTLESSPSRITSSPSLSPQSSPLRDITIQDAEIPQSQFPTQTQVADEAAFTSVDVDARGAATTDIGVELTDRVEVLDNDLQQTKKVYSSSLIKLIMRVKKLEHRVKTRQPRRRARVIISDTEEDLEDPSKQGRRIAEIDQNPSISLVQDEGTSWIQEDAKIQGKTSADTEILLDQEEPTELVEDLGSGEKGEKEISTANISVSTASATPEVSTAAANLVYIRRSAEKRKDKGKAIMKEDESLQEEFDRARQEQEVIAEADQAHDIDWSDPAVLRYHALQNRSFSVAEVRKNMCMYLKNQGGYKQSHFKGMSYEDIRLIFERVWDQNHAFVPKDSEIEKEVMKRPGFDFPQKSIKKNDDSQQQAGSSKKRSREDSDEDNAKKQKLEDDAEK
ncbi:hypothetical protein Tco_1156903 [Tanacetum coccineum]